MLRGQKWKALINLRKFENDALKVRSVKNFKSLPGVPTITVFVAAFDAKGLNYKELLKSYLAGGNRIINRHRKPTEIATIEIFDKTHGLRFFYKNHICIFLSVFKKCKHTAAI